MAERSHIHFNRLWVRKGSIYFFVCLVFFHLSVCLFVCLFVCLYVCLFVCLFVSFFSQETDSMFHSHCLLSRVRLAVDEDLKMIVLVPIQISFCLFFCVGSLRIYASPLT